MARMRAARLSFMTAFSPFSLECDSVSARRGGETVLTGVSFTLKSGERLDLIGANGSGKTSLLRILSGMDRPGAGSVRLKDGPAASIWIHDKDPLEDALTVRETLEFWAKIMACDGMNNTSALGLDERLDQPVSALSRGWRRRLSLTRAVASQRAIWLLDEPLAGLDAQGRDAFGACMQAHLNQGGAIIVARHADDAGPAADLTLTLARP